MKIAGYLALFFVQLAITFCAFTIEGAYISQVLSVVTLIIIIVFGTIQIRNDIKEIRESKEKEEW